MSRDRSHAVVIRLPPAAATAAARDRLVALLADFDLIAIHEDDPDAPRQWTAHFADVSSRDAAAAALAAQTELGDGAITPVDVEDEDWARRTQADLPAIRVGRIIVAPPWDLPPSTPDPPDIVIEIEPSRGFGTGHHQSTRLCLVLLQARDLAGRTVLDVGTGSGVLAIAAAKLGATFVNAIDLDPDAIENARENIERNRVAGVVEAHVRDVSTGQIPPADVVVANLTGTLLVRHATQLGALVRPSGSAIVAGFTVDEQILVREAFAAAFDVTESAEEEGWWAFVLTRAVSPST